MFAKYERKSDRVKCVSFHHSRPWLLSALHSGVIELIDYRLKQRIGTYEEHVGPVRGVQFHPNLSLFCSGGDDFTVRVWNYKSCQFVLKGHLDYVRSVTFHPNLPWVLSGSDDQTARVWNYQSRQTIAIITGHTNYVMRCEFHPKDDFIITCSLDQTARLWSYTTLKTRYAQKKTQEYVLSGAEVQLIANLDTHKDQLNWCAFHPSQPFIATAADDHNIKLWKYTDSKAWEFDTLRGHTNNVCSVDFHRKEDVLISDSEDHTIKIWDFNKRQEICSYENKNMDRYWVIQCHLDNYYFACGSDTSLQVFTLHKDRVPITLVNDRYLCLAEKKKVKVIELQSGTEQVIKELNGQAYISQNLLEDNVEHIAYNVYDTQKTQLMLRLIRSITEPNKLKKHVLLVFHPGKTDQNLKYFTAKEACFIGKSRILRINESGQLESYNFETDDLVKVNEQVFQKIFAFQGGKAIAYGQEQLHIIDLKLILNSVECPAVIKHVKHTDQWIVCASKLSIIIFTHQLQKVLEIKENINIKSFLFVGDILLYSTKAQIKYAILNGDTGILRSTEHILYLAKADLQQQTVTVKAIDNRAMLQTLSIDLREALFKQAIYKQDINNIKLPYDDEATLAYLNSKKLASLSLKLVKDPMAKFALSLDSGNLKIAYQIATTQKDPALDEQLRVEAIRQGNHIIVDICDQQLRKLDRLSLLYVCVGARDKLQKLSNIHQSYSNSLYSNDLNARFTQLQFQPKLRELSQDIHGDQNIQLSPEQLESLQWIKDQQPSCLMAPLPINQNTDPWPLLDINEKDQLRLESKEQEIVIQRDEFTLERSDPVQIQQVEEPFEEINDQWGIEELEPVIGEPFDNQALNRTIKSEIPADYFAAGQFEEGFLLLEKNFALVNRQPLLAILKGQASEYLTSEITFIAPIPQSINVPRSNEIKTLFKLGLKLTTEAKFNEVTQTFTKLLHVLLVTKPHDTVDNVQSMIETIKNYLLAMRIESNKSKNPLEMACKMAAIDLQPSHRILTLRQALSVAYKAKNFITCQVIAHKLIELLKQDQTQKPDVLLSAQKYEKAAQQQNTNAVDIDFQESYLNQNTFCAITFKQITEFNQCPFDRTIYDKSYSDVCVICGVCKVN